MDDEHHAPPAFAAVATVRPDGQPYNGLELLKLRAFMLRRPPASAANRGRKPPWSSGDEPGLLDRDEPTGDAAAEALRVGS